MKIGIFGAGAIGGYVGGCLAVAGAQVTLIARGDRLQVLRSHGLRLADLSGRRQATRDFTASDDPVALAGCDLIIVAVKSAQTEAAASALSAVLSAGPPVLSLQNGIRNADIFAAGLPGSQILRGMVPFNVVTGPDGLHRRTTSGDICTDPEAAPFASIFARAGLPLSLRPDMQAVQWGKLIVNLNNAVNALSGLPLKAQLQDRNYRRCLALAQVEAIRLLRAEGRIHPARLTPVPPAIVPTILRLPDPLFQMIAKGMLKIDPAARSSMADDMTAGRPTEIDYINGEIVTLAARLARSAPINARLCDLIRAGRRPIASGELLSDLRSAQA